MNKADVEFTVGLNTSPAEQQLSKFLTDVQSQKNRIQKLLDNPQKYSEERYLSNLSKLETMQNRYGIEKVSTNSNLPSSEYHRFMNLQNAVARYEREVNKVFERSNSVLSVANSYTSQKNVRDAHPGMFEARMKSVTEMELDRLTVEKNKAIARGSYETWKNLTSNNILALPAPEEKKKDAILAPDNKTAVEEAHNLAEEDKKDNTELNDKILKWGKIAVIIYGIKKVLEGLAKAWKIGAEAITTGNANLNQDLGFFSVDPEGAMRANTDTTRAKIYAGIRNMGANSPVSKEGFDYTAQKFTDMWTAAMSGREVDARTAIDVQRLKEFFGIDISPAALLTGQKEGKTATDVQIDVMNKVEKQLNKLNEADQTTKGQVIDSLRNLLGDEMVNAIVANFNKNARMGSGDKLTVSERLEQSGTSTLSLRDYTKKVTDAVTSMANLKDSFDSLKKTLVEDLAPAFTTVTQALTKFVDWLNRKSTKTTPDTVTPGGVSTNLVIDNALKGSDEGEVFGNNKQRKLTASEKIKNATTANEILDGIYLLNPNLVSEGNLERLKQDQYIDEAFDALVSGTLDENSQNPLERYLANYEYGGLKGIEALKLAEKKGVFGRGRKAGQWVFRQAIKGIAEERPKREDHWTTVGYKNALNQFEGWENLFTISPLFKDFVNSEFGEGGASDWNEGKGIYDYLMDSSYYKTANDWYDALKRYKEELGDFGNEYIKSISLPSKESLWGEDRKLQFDEVRFILETTDGRVLSTVTQAPHIEGYY